MTAPALDAPTIPTRTDLPPHLAAGLTRRGHVTLPLPAILDPHDDPTEATP